MGHTIAMMVFVAHIPMIPLVWLDIPLLKTSITSLLWSPQPMLPLFTVPQVENFLKWDSQLFNTNFH